MSGRFLIPWEQLKAGDSARLELEMSDEAVRAFSTAIGDTDSFHISDEAAACTCFGRRVCHGVHLLSCVSRAIGTLLPGFGTIYDSHSVTFHAPVYVGDHVCVRLRVLEKLPRRRVWLETTMMRGDGALVLSGEALVKTHQ